MTGRSVPSGSRGPAYRLYRPAGTAGTPSRFWVGFPDADALVSHVAASFAADEALEIAKAAPDGGFARVACRAADVAKWRPDRAPLPDGVPVERVANASAARLRFLREFRRTIDAGEAAGVLSRIEADAFALAALDLVGRRDADPGALASLITSDPPARSPTSRRR